MDEDGGEVFGQAREVGLDRGGVGVAGAPGHALRFEIDTAGDGRRFAGEHVVVGAGDFALLVDGELVEHDGVAFFLLGEGPDAEGIPSGVVLVLDGHERLLRDRDGGEVEGLLAVDGGRCHGLALDVVVRLVVINLRAVVAVELVGDGGTAEEGGQSGPRGGAPPRPGADRGSVNQRGAPPRGAVIPIGHEEVRVVITDIVEDLPRAVLAVGLPVIRPTLPVLAAVGVEILPVVLHRKDIVPPVVAAGLELVETVGALRVQGVPMVLAVLLPFVITAGTTVEVVGHARVLCEAVARRHAGRTAVVEVAAALDLSGSRGGAGEVGRTAVGGAGHFVVAGQFRALRLQVAEVDRFIDPVLGRLAGGQFAARGRAGALLGNLRALHRAGRLGRRWTVRALVAGGLAHGRRQPAATGVGRSLDVGRPRHIGGALDIGRTRHIGGALDVGRTLDIGGTLAPSAGCRILSGAVGLEHRGGEEQCHGGDGEAGSWAAVHGYLTAVNLIGPSFGMGTPPLSRL